MASGMVRCRVGGSGMGLIDSGGLRGLRFDLPWIKYSLLSSPGGCTQSAGLVVWVDFHRTVSGYSRRPGLSSHHQEQ
jgi:hypothetical protein